MSTIFRSPLNPQIQKAKYQHLLTGLYRRLTAAEARQDRSLVAQLNAELIELQAEVRGII
jgi:hypothetical protein